MEFSEEDKLRWLGSLSKRMSSASVMCETPDGKLLIVKAHYKPYWSVPGGVIDAGETPREAAVRETREEVGINLNPASLEFVYVANRKSAITDSYQFLFKARIKQSDLDSIQLEASEIANYKLVSKDDIRAILDDSDLNGMNRMERPGDELDHPGAGAGLEARMGRVIRNWALGTEGYLEQQLTLDSNRSD